MNSNREPELLEQIRQQFDFSPYPNAPLDILPDASQLYIHNIITAYYTRDKQIINPANKIILDAGCGSGAKSLILAMSNPKAKIIGIDLSEKSIELARQRFQYHGLDNGEFYQCSIEDLPQLVMSFDYINCDEVLYLFPEPAKALKIFKSVLKPQGIIRANFHSLLQRFSYFQAQELFKTMRLMDHNPEDMEISVVIDTMNALKDNIYLKVTTWQNIPVELRENKQWILMNYLFHGDKGYTITDIFSFLTEADLEFINMVNWRQWNFLELFKDSDNLPVFWGLTLPELTIEQTLRLYELLNPVHRLLDFWCGHPGETLSYIPLSDWQQEDWQNATVYLHPQLNTEQVKQEMYKTIQTLQPLVIRNIVSEQSTNIDHQIAAILLSLFDSPQAFPCLVERYQKLYPYDPITLEPRIYENIFNALLHTLTLLEGCGYILISQKPKV